MAERNKNNHLPKLFYPPDPYNPIDNIVAAGLNIATHHGLNRFSREVARVLGVSGDSIHDQINLNRSKLALEEQQAVTAKVKVLKARWKSTTARLWMMPSKKTISYL